MKKYLLTAILFALVSCTVCFSAPITANTDLALGKAAYGTFNTAAFVTDGKVRGGFATSGDTTDVPQYLTVDLGTNLYLDRIKIYWDKDALSNGFEVRTSPDAKFWNSEASGLDASFGVLDNASGTMAVSISLKRAVISSRYVQIMVPASSKINNKKGNVVRIAEIEVYPAVNQVFTLIDASTYAVTDKSAIIKYDTSIGAAYGRISYGLEPAAMTSVALNSQSGAANFSTISPIKSKTPYFYQIRATDFYGKIVTSEVKSFTTLSENVALNKKVTGTFSNLAPKDPYVKAGAPDEILSRITDGGTSYFTSMGTSGNIADADQYVVIDLGQTYNIQSIISYWRALAYPQSLTVQVSDDNAAWNTIASGLDVGQGAFARSEGGDPLMVLNTPGASGRYLKLLVPKGSSFFHKHDEWNFVQLMEVQVFTK